MALLNNVGWKEAAVEPKSDTNVKIKYLKPYYVGKNTHAHTGGVLRSDPRHIWLIVKMGFTRCFWP